MDYTDFLKTKADYGADSGFAPLWMPDFLFDFQKALVEWSVRRGRSAIFADCGLGKTPIQLVWAENVVRKTNKPVLILTPLAVSHQTVREADKFEIEAVRSNDGKVASGARIVVTNYERLHKFDWKDFAGCVGDESSILKSFDGQTKEQVTEFMRQIPYRLLCTATAAPNDYIELGTSSEALGELGYMDMLARFFKSTQNGGAMAHGGNMAFGGRRFAGRQNLFGAKFRFRGHAEKDFWRWVCSWARAIRKPSDMGFDDGKFKLPKLVTQQYIVKAETKNDNFLFDMPAITLAEQRSERRRTLKQRCEKAAELVANTKQPFVCWCELNDEGDTLEEMIPDAVQVSGSDSDEVKEERYRAFESGQSRGMITKPVCAGFGLNWQHCAHQTFFPSHSFEQYYQAVRRSWRFGQKRTVTIDVITSECESRVLANLQRKEAAASEMFSNLVATMNNVLHLKQTNDYKQPEEIPAWL
jgi:hypothetical protein